MEHRPRRSLTAVTAIGSGAEDNPEHPDIDGPATAVLGAWAAVAVTERATLRIPGTPPSFNKVGLHSHWAVGRKAKQEWEQWIHFAILEQAVPRGLMPRGLKSVTASAAIRFKQKRQRDEGNFRVLLEKALGDVLQNGWIPGDTPEHYRFGRVELIAPVKKPETIIVLDYEV